MYMADGKVSNDYPKDLKTLFELDGVFSFNACRTSETNVLLRKCGQEDYERLRVA